jgi:hypothetical protein
MSESIARVCALCGKPATMMCGGCKKVDYCSTVCQREHWGVHKTTCVGGQITIDPDVNTKYDKLGAAVKAMYEAPTAARVIAALVTSVDRDGVKFPRTYGDTVFSANAAVGSTLEFVNKLYETMYWVPFLAATISSGSVTIVENHAAVVIWRAVKAHLADKTSANEKLAALPVLFHAAFAAIFNSADPIEADVGHRGTWFLEAMQESLFRENPSSEHSEAVGHSYGGFRGRYGWGPGLGYGLGLGLGVPLAAGMALGYY